MIDAGWPTVPRGISIALFLGSFYFMGYQYSQIDNPRRFLNARFGILALCVPLLALTVFWTPRHPILSEVFFVIGLAYAYLSYRLWRLMPPPSQKKY